MYGSRTHERRETLFEDRTHCHADHVVFGSKRDTTAAVGVLKAVGFSEEERWERQREDLTVLLCPVCVHVYMHLCAYVCVCVHVVYMLLCVPVCMYAV